MARFDRSIPPGGEGKILLSVKTTGFEGPIQKGARIISNDPTSPESSVSIKARVIPIISVKPSWIYLTGFRGESIVRSVTVHTYEELALRLDPVKPSISDKVDYQIETVEEGKTYHIVFRNKLNQEGKYRGVLHINTNYPEKPLIRIGINGDIKGTLQVSPKTIYFGRLDIAKLKSSNKNVLIRSLKIKSAKEEHLKIEKIDYNRDLFEVSVREIQSGRIYAVELRLSVETLVPGTLSEKLIIHTDLKDNPSKEITILGYVR